MCNTVCSILTRDRPFLDINQLAVLTKRIPLAQTINYMYMYIRTSRVIHVVAVAR